MSAAAPLWTVVVPTYRRPEQLARCLRALAAVRAPAGAGDPGGGVGGVGGGVEVLVVDDGGPPGPGSAREVAAGVPGPHRVRVHHQDNAGPAAARNAGARLAAGRWLAFTDDDCAPAPGWLAAMGPHLRGGDVLVGGRTVNARRRDLCAEATQTMVSHLVEPAAGASPTFFPTCNLALRAASFEAVGGFDTSFPRAAGEDRAFCDAWRAPGRALVHEPAAVVEHAHALTLAGFWRQHRAYGEAAVAVHRLRRERGMPDAGRAPLAFYLALLARPLREQEPRARPGAVRAAGPVAGGHRRRGRTGAAGPQRCASHRLITAATRHPARPSHSGGSSGGRGGSSSAARAAAPRSARSTRRLVPWVIVTGRSVLGRTVRHGTPSTVVSSCRPPLSVTTRAAPATRERNSP